MKSIGDSIQNDNGELFGKFKGMKRVKIGVCEKCRPKDDRIPPRPIMKQIYPDGKEIIETCVCEREKSANNLQREINAKRYASASMLGKRDYGKSFDNFDVEVESERIAKEAAIEFVENFSHHMKEGNSLLLQGTWGTGKTHLALAIREELKEKNYKVLFIKFPDYIELLKEAFDDDKTYFNTKILPLQQMALEADLLIIDEVWAESSYEIKQLYKLVNGRDGLSNIYTTNYGTKEFLSKEGLGKSFSRMLDSSELLKLDGRDKRRRNIRR